MQDGSSVTTRITALLNLLDVWGKSDDVEPCINGEEVWVRLCGEGRGGAAAGAGVGAGAMELGMIAERKVYPETWKQAYLTAEPSQPHSFSKIASCNLSQSWRVEVGRRRYHRSAFPANAVDAKVVIHFWSSVFPNLNACTRTARMKSSASSAPTPRKTAKSSVQDTDNTDRHMILIIASSAR